MATCTIPANFFGTQNHPQYLSRFSPALFPTSFLEMAVDSQRDTSTLMLAAAEILVVFSWSCSSFRLFQNSRSSRSKIALSPFISVSTPAVLFLSCQWLHVWIVSTCTKEPKEMTISKPSGYYKGYTILFPNEYFHKLVSMFVLTFIPTELNISRPKF